MSEKTTKSLMTLHFYLIFQVIQNISCILCTWHKVNVNYIHWYVYTYFIHVSTGTEPQCISKSIPGREEFHCLFQSQLTSVLCSFDDGEQENCSFPLVVERERFGINPHVVNVTVIEESTESQELSFTFQLRDGEESH